MRSFLHLLLFTAFLSLSLVGCVDNPQSFYQNDLAAVGEGEIYLSLETAPDGTGEKLSTVSIECGTSSTVYAVLREQSTDASLASMEVEWESDRSIHLTTTLSSFTSLNATENGNFALNAKYSDEGLNLNASIFVVVTGSCGLPVTPYEHFDVSKLSLSPGDSVDHFEGLMGKHQLNSLESNSVPFYGEEDGKAYLEFSGAQALKTNSNLAIEGNQARTIIAVAMPYQFGRDDDPLHPPQDTAAAMLGFGRQSGNRSIFDFNFFRDGEFITNFYGPTIGYDDSYNNFSPEAELDEIQIFTARYTNSEHPYYGKHISYINGDEGNSVWTLLQTNPGPLYLGRSVLGSTSITENFKGRIYEVIIFNKELSDEEVDQIHQFLVEKYNL